MQGHAIQTSKKDASQGHRSIPDNVLRGNLRPCRCPSYRATGERKNAYLFRRRRQGEKQKKEHQETLRCWQIRWDCTENFAQWTKRLIPNIEAYGTVVIKKHELLSYTISHGAWVIPSISS
ncbi:hypothetical protein JTB14_033709 [Gonioctena quinquepunctata]|nr:hypothetical protein JTB14_033709 [Gonioctena quinquepunctata]